MSGYGSIYRIHYGGKEYDQKVFIDKYGRRRIRRHRTDKKTADHTNASSGPENPKKDENKQKNIALNSEESGPSRKTMEDGDPKKDSREEKNEEKQKNDVPKSEESGSVPVQ